MPDGSLLTLVRNVPAELYNCTKTFERPALVDASVTRPVMTPPRTLIETPWMIVLLAESVS